MSSISYSLTSSDNQGGRPVVSNLSIHTKEHCAVNQWLKITDLNMIVSILIFKIYYHVYFFIHLTLSRTLGWIYQYNMHYMKTYSFFLEEKKYLMVKPRILVFLSKNRGQSRSHGSRYDILGDSHKAPGCQNLPLGDWNKVPTHPFFN